MNDDLPWPELGNVSRGATRGNQGSKGALGPTDASGCAILQLRVQPGVLAVKLNRQSTDWYRILDREVQGALKLTKTYWRKARRRQDYDARADQDHMELHEWLQQLKDKCMAHLELLMQKGDIQGPPYVMPDGIELTFMRKFIERQAAGIPHNPRLRDLPRDEQQQQRQMAAMAEDMGDSDTTDARGSIDASEAGPSNWSQRSPVSSFQAGRPPHSHSSASSPTWSKINTDVAAMPNDLSATVARIEVTNQALGRARERASLARQTVNEVYARYNSVVDVASREEQEVQRIQEQLDDLINHMVRLTGSPPSTAMASSLTLPPATLPNGMQPPPTPSSSTSVAGPLGPHQRPPGSGAGPGPGHGPPTAHGHHPHSHPHTHGHGHGHGPQTPVTSSLAGLQQYGADPSGLPPYQQHQQHQAHHAHGMAPQPQPQHAGYSSPWGDPPHAHPLVGPPVRPTSSASVGGVPMGLNGAPGAQQQQARYGGEIREDSWGPGAGGGEGDLEPPTRGASPIRKHPRDWDASQQQLISASRDVIDVRPFSARSVASSSTYPYSPPTPASFSPSSFYAHARGPWTGPSPPFLTSPPPLSLSTINIDMVSSTTRGTSRSQMDRGKNICPGNA